MSRCFKQLLTCPNCHHHQDYLVWYSLNNEEYPEVNKALRNGDLFNFQCEQCQHNYFVERHFVYHMITENLMFHLVLDQDDEAKTFQQIKQLQVQSFKHSTETKVHDSIDKTDAIHQRIVRHYEDLIEKMTIAEAGLDDHIIELMKHMMIEKAIGYFPIEFEDFRFSILNDEATFIFIYHHKVVHRVPFSMPFYQKVYHGFKALIAEDDDLLIDEEWADQMYDLRESEKDL